MRSFIVHALLCIRRLVGPHARTGYKGLGRMGEAVLYLKEAAR
jgi:hypothetical protein